MSESIDQQESRGLGRSASLGAATVMGGQILRIVIQFAGMIVMIRLLAPREFGLLAMVTVIIGLGEIFRDFGLSTAAIQAKSLTKHQRDNLFWSNSAIGFLLAVVVFFSSDLLAAFYDEPAVKRLAQWLALLFIINGISTQYRASLNRSLRFIALSGAELGGQILGLTAGIALALHGAGYWALVAQQLVQATVTLVLLISCAKWLPGWIRRNAPMRDLYSYAGHLVGTQLLGYASSNADTVVIGSTIGAGPLGIYNRAFQLLMAPLSQLNAPATRVALPVLARLQDDSVRYQAFIVRGQTILANLVLVVLFYSCSQALPIVSVVFGERWLEIVPIFQVLAIAGIFQALGYSNYWVYLSKGLSKQQFRISIIVRPILAAAIIGGCLLWGVIGVAWTYSLGIAVLWPIHLWWLSRVSDAPIRAMITTAARPLAVHALGGGASLGTAHLMADGPYWLSLTVGAAAMLVVTATAAAVWPVYRRDWLAIFSTLKLLRRRVGA